MSRPGVFETLLAVFPQVDLRLLKAIAIEYADDVDAAADIVLRDVIPSIGHPEQSHSLSNMHNSNAPSSDGTDHLKDVEVNARSNELYLQEEEGRSLPCCLKSMGSSVGLQDTWLSKGPSVILNATNSIAEDSRDLPNIRYANEKLYLGNDNVCQPLRREAGLVASQVNTIQFFSPEAGDTQERKMICGSRTLPNHADLSDPNISFLDGIGSFEHSLCPTGIPIEDLYGSQDFNSAVCASSQDALLDFDDFFSSLEVPPKEHDTENSFSENGTVETMPEKSNDKDNIIFPSICSSNYLSTTFLEDCMVDARDNKNNLLAELESVTDMVNDVQLLEAKVSEAKRENCNAVEDILLKVEENKPVLRRAKEANEMHSADVNGEKSILATEVQELQTRLKKLSDDRDKHMEILNEMRAALVVRIAAAEQEITAAKAERQTRETAARNALLEQEAEMARIVEESMRLNQEASRNEELREYLIGKGRAVDALQGEIGVIFEDIMGLKEIVDAGLPLGKLQRSTMSSLSSSSHSSMKKSIARTEPLAQLSNSGEPHLAVEHEHNEEQSTDGGWYSDVTPENDDLQSANARNSCDDSGRRHLVVPHADGANESDDGWEFCDK